MTPKLNLYSKSAFKVTNQNSALFGVRGKGITSRIFDMPVTKSNNRSNPRPNPE